MQEKENHKISILLVEDDPNLGMLLQDYLDMAGYVAAQGMNGKDGLELFEKQHFDLCILDVMMPKMDGFSLAAEIRKRNAAIPIIFLTAKSLKEDRLKGFQQGCDDYITKPFSTDELNMRIKAILRRCFRTGHFGSDAQENIYSIGKYTFDVPNMMLVIEDKQQGLTRKETALLQLLCKHKNKLMPRELALSIVWGDADYFAGRSMDVFIARLRKYLKDDPAVTIHNEHGLGFKLITEEN